MPSPYRSTKRLSLSLLLLLFGCGGGGDAGTSDAGTGDLTGGGAVSFSRDVAPLIGQSCTGYCHPGGYSPMSLRADVLYQNLVNADSAGCTQTPRKRVAPGRTDAKDSYLMAKLLGQDLCNGTQMPPTGKLPAASIEVVRRWIEAGAKND